MNYYDEIIAEIKELIANGNFEEALEKLKEELRMPYVPAEPEKELKALHRMVMAELNANSKVQRIIPDDDELKESLFSANLDEEMGTIQIIRKLKLSDYYQLIRDYLKTPIYGEIASLLIYMLIEDKCSEEFIVLKDGMDVTFIPSECKLPEDGECYLWGIQYLDEKVNKDPSILKMCKDMLHLKLLANLPFTYERDEMEIICKVIILQVYRAMDLEEELENLAKENNWNLNEIAMMS